jgi:regulatory protein
MNIEWEIDKNNPKLLIIKVDQEPWKEVPKSLFFKGLKTLKKCLNLKDLENAFCEIEAKLCNEQAVRYLAIRSHGSSELKQKLSLKGFSFQAIDIAVKRCDQLGYLDDLQHIKAVVRNELRKGYGPHLIALKIKALGNIAAETLSGIMREIEGQQIEAIRSLISKRYSKTCWKDPKQKNKVIQSLRRRGFYLDAIISILKNLY